MTEEPRFYDDGSPNPKAWNPRVIAWAEAHDVDPHDLVRDDPEDDLFRIERTPWTVLFSEWITAKWREWRAPCTHKFTREQPFCPHCNNHDEFNAWLVGGRNLHV